MSVATKAPRSLDELVERYNEAWNDHDLEAILALQTPDCEFRFHGAGEFMSWEGIDACREAYDHLLRAWPDQRFVQTRIEVDRDIYVCHHELTATLVEPWPMNGRIYQPIGKPITFEVVDIMYCRDNLVHVCDGWIDGLSVHEQLTAGAPGPS